MPNDTEDRALPGRRVQGRGRCGIVLPVSAPHRARRLAILGSLYVAQGIVFGFGAWILVPTLAAGGVSLTEQTGILALGGLPWVFKLLWGPVLDRFGGLGSGRARGFATGAMVVMGACLIALATRDGLVAAPRTVAGLWLLLNAAMSLQDVSTDALVIDLVPPAERGLTNGVLLGGHHLGAEGIGGLALGMLVASRGMAAALWAQAVIMLLLAGLPHWLPRAEAGRGATRPSLLDALLALLRTPGALRVAVLTAVIMSADVLTSAVAAEFWVQELGWSVERMSTTLVPLLLVVSLLGYAAATVVVDRLGHGRSAALASGGLGSLWVAFGLVPALWSSDAFMMVFVTIQGVITAVLTVGLHARLMDATEPTLRASHFAVLMALYNLPRAAVVPAAPSLLEALGFPGLFVACGAFQLLMVVGLRLAGLTAPAR